MSENSHDQVLAESERDRADPGGVIAARDAEITRLSQQLQQRLAESRAMQQRLEETEREQVAQRALLEQNAETLQQYTEITRQCAEVIYQYAGINHQQAQALTRLQTDREHIRQTLLTVSHTRTYQLLRALGRWETVAQTLALVAEQPAEQLAEQPVEQLDDAEQLPARTLTRIAVDLTPLLPGGENDGARDMVLALLRHLSQAASEVEFVLLTSEKNHEALAVLEAANVQRCCMTRRQSPAHALRPPGGLPRDMRADLVFCPFTASFFADPAIPLVAVVHDLQYLYYPQFFSPEAIQERDTCFRHAAQQAKRLICISDDVRQTVLDHTAVQPEDVTTIHTGLPGKATPLAPEQRMAVLERFGLRAGRFLLYPANFWPHKNHRMLLTAFKIYRTRHQGSDLDLVCTGTPNADMECLRDAVAHMELAGAVRFPGDVSDEVFSALLQACRALIFPSLYESSGSPVLEAMALGKPVLCSRVASLPEVAGDAAVYFDPRKPAEIVRAIERIDSDTELAERLMHLGYERLATFGDASETAQRYLQVFRDVVRDFPYPPYTFYGIYADGWIGSRAVIAYGASAEQRHLELIFTLPPGTPYPCVSVDVRHQGNTSTVPYILTCGAEELIRLELSHQESSIELWLVPAFQPRAHAMGEDMRILSCLCSACRIVSEHDTTDLLAGRG